MKLILAVIALVALGAGCTQAQTHELVRSVTEQVVKVYGAGGIGSIEAYQSGVVISAEGHVVTANSLVLDQGEVTVVLSSGARHSGQVLGADPVANIAVVKFDPAGEEVARFSLQDSTELAPPGEPVLVLANVFGIAAGNEPVSVMHGVVAAVAPLRAQGGTFERIDGGEVYILDAVTSNPGAAGGAVVDHRGRLLGMLGRELRSRVTGAWLNYAIPAHELRVSATRIIQGQESAAAAPDTVELANFDLLDRFGFELAPEIVNRTPPYVDYVKRGSAAGDAGLRPDDLIVTVDGFVTGSVIEVRRVLSRRVEPWVFEFFVQRGDEFVELSLSAPGADDRSGERGEDEESP